VTQPRSSKLGWALAVSDLLGGLCIPLHHSLYIYLLLLVFCTLLHSPSLHLRLQSPLITPLSSLAINLSKYTIIFIVRSPSAVYAPLLIVFPSRSRSPLPHRAIPLVHPSTLFYFISFLVYSLFSFLSVYVFGAAYVIIPFAFRSSSFLHSSPDSRVQALLFLLLLPLSF